MTSRWIWPWKKKPREMTEAEYDTFMEKYQEPLAASMVRLGLTQPQVEAAHAEFIKMGKTQKELHFSQFRGLSRQDTLRNYAHFLMGMAAQHKEKDDE